MAEEYLDQFEVDGTEYNLQDTSARNALRSIGLDIEDGVLIIHPVTSV